MTKAQAELACEEARKMGYVAHIEHYNGARGISVCERWHRFENFLADMGEPKPGQSLERIDNHGNYEPGNCKWATRSEQGRNKRNNRLVTYQGETLCVAEWAERRGLKYLTLYMRLFASGWDVERALNTPVR